MKTDPKQCADASNVGENIVYKGTNHRLHKDNTKMDNPPSTPASIDAHGHGHRNNA